MISDLRPLTDALSAQAGDIAMRLLGEPNHALSSRRELRFGNHGSLAVVTSGPKAGGWYDHELQQGGDVLELIRREQRCSFPEAIAIAQELVGFSPAITHYPAPNRKPSEPDTKAQQSNRARIIWNEAGRLDDSPALIYLRNRGIRLSNLSKKIRDVLQWHPACPWGEGGSRHGCMIALWTDVITGDPQAIHRIAITPDGKKVDRRALGPTRGCVIRLWPDDDVTSGLVIGEGIETVLAAATRISHSGTLLQPAWACGYAGALRHFPVLAGIEALTILVDHDDEKEAGQRAAAVCADRWTDAGREVIRLVPDQYGDFNNIIGEKTP